MKKSGKIFIRNDLKIDHLWGIPTFGSPMEKLLRLLDYDQFKKPVWIATINPEFVMNALKDPYFLRILVKDTTVNVLDGVGLVWGKEVVKWPRWMRIWVGFRVGIGILRGKYRENMVTGVELMDQLCSKAVRENKSVYFFGGWGDRADKTAKYFVNRYPGLKVAGARDENYDFKTKADYLFVARGMKKQEMWIRENIKKLKVGVVVGVGRSFDYYSGELKRAPLRVRRLGFEWLYSLIKEPVRWRRQLVLPKFIWRVLTIK